MAKIPDGVTRARTSDSDRRGMFPVENLLRGMSPVENLLETLLETLGESESTQILKYKEELRLAKQQTRDLENQKKAKKEATESFGIDYDVIRPAMEEYDKVIQSSTDTFYKMSADISQNLEALLLREDVAEKMEKEQLDRYKELVAVSKTYDSMKQDSARSSKSKAKSKGSSRSMDKFTDTALDIATAKFSIVTKPLESLLGIDINGIIKGGFSKIFKRGEDKEETGEFLTKRRSPKNSELKKAGVIGAAAVYIGDLLHRTLGGNKESATASGGVTPAVSAGGIGATLTKMGGIAAIAGGIIWGVIDSIKAVMNSDEWGVSKVSAAIGGFLSGDGEGGLKSAFKGMGKWALIGAGVGMLGGPVGILAGGLIGAAIGGILGWIGGEKTAKFIDPIVEWTKEAWEKVKAFFMAIPEFISTSGEWLDNAWSTMVEFVTETVPAKAVEIYNKVKTGIVSFFTTSADWIVSSFNSVKEFLKNIFLNSKNAVIGFFSTVSTFLTVTLPEWAVEKYTELKVALADFFSPAYNAVLGFFTTVKTFFTDTLPIWATEKYTELKTAVTGFFVYAKDGVLGFFTSVKTLFTDTLPTWATEQYEKVKTTVTGIFVYAKDGVLGFFTSVKTLFTDTIPTWATEKYTEVKTSLKGFFDTAKSAVLGFFSPLTTFFGETLPTWATEKFTAIKDGLKDFFSPAYDAVMGLFTNITDIFSSDSSVWDKIKNIGSEIFSTVINAPLTYISGLFVQADTWFTSILGEKWVELYASLKTTIKSWFGLIFNPFIDGVTSFITGAKITLSDEETSLWEKVTGIAKSLLTTLVTIPIDYVTGLLTKADEGLTSILSTEWAVKYEDFKTSVKSWFGIILNPLLSGITTWFSGWKDTFSSVSSILGEEESTVWDKVKGVASELITGMVMGPINLIKGWIDGLLANEKFKEIKDSMLNLFTDVGQKIKEWALGLVPDWMKDGVSKAKDAGAAVVNTVTEAVSGSVVGKAAGKVADVASATWDGITGFFGGKKAEGVNDAIIYKDGKLYKPHADDHIIATKTPPATYDTRGQMTSSQYRAIGESNRGVQGDIQTIQKTMNTTVDVKEFGTMTALLTSILDVLRDKDMAPTFTEVALPNKMNFSLLR